MKIEHVAWQVDEPAAMTEWYGSHLGFTLKRGSDDPFPVRFLADGGGQVMIELYNNPDLKTPDYGSMSPLLLHLALSCDEIEATIERLVEAGATVATEPSPTPAGDVLAMLRDPWGLAIQLCQRRTPMV